MSSNTKIEATSGKFENCDTTQNNLDFFLSSPQKVVKKSTPKKLKNSNQSSNLTTTNELEEKSLLDNSTQTPTDTSVTAINADDYTRNTAGGNARPTPISADFAENIELNKTLLLDFIEALLESTPPEHKNPVEAALNALRYTNKYKLTIPCLLDAFVCGLVKLNVPKEIIKLTTPILCEVLPDTTPELVERKINEENNGFELEFFSQYHAENYDNFSGKFVDNSWLAELNKAKNGFVNNNPKMNNENRLKFEPCEVLEMPPAEPEISQAELAATGTHGDLPNNFNEIKIKNAEAQKDAPANSINEVIKLKGDAQKDLTMILNENTHTANNNAENDTNAATDATNSASNIKTPPAKNHAKNQKSKADTAMPKYDIKKDYSGYIYSQDPVAEFESILTAYGLIVNKNIIQNKICRVGTSNNPKGDAGWLKYHTSTFYTSKGEELIYLHGVYGNWSDGCGTQFINITNYNFENRNDSAEYLKEMQQIRKQAEKTRAEQVAKLEKEIQTEYNKTAEKATQFYNEICDFYNYEKFPIEDPHEYLKNKNLFIEIPPEIKVINSQKADAYFGYRLAGKGGKLADGEWLVIPIYNNAKKGVRTLQLIDINGNKTMLKGGEAGGGYFEIESNNKTANYAIVEGPADALALIQVLTNFNVIVAFSAGNIIKVVGELVNANSKAKITIFADNDKESHTGEIQAKKAVEAHGGKYIMPPTEYKDFCDFWTAEFANNNGNINAVISIMQNYINALLNAETEFRDLQKQAERKLVFEREKSKDDDKVGKIKATSQNVIEALLCKEYCGFEFILEERSQNIEVIDYLFKKTDKNGEEIIDETGKPIMLFKDVGKKTRQLKQLDLGEIKTRLEYHPKNNPTGFAEISVKHILIGALGQAASYKKYNKIKNFINKLPKLTGEALQKAIYKLENLFIYYANADVERFPVEYYKRLARCFMTEIIARCLTETGCRADYTPILQGKQGCGKSKFCENLISDPSLCVSIDFDDKTDDIIRKISGKVIAVIEEMNGFRKKQASSVKKFLTAKQDTLVPKFENFDKTTMRSNVFVGNTNEEHFLNDDTGERRYYPVPITPGKETRHLELRRDIDEIYAAALHLYNEDLKIGTEITADGKEVEHNGVLYQELEKWNEQVTKEFKEENPYITNIERWLNTTYKHNDYIEAPDYFVAGKKPYNFEYLLPVDIAMFALEVTKDKYNIHTHGKNIKAALIELGYKNQAKRINGKPTSVYVRQNSNHNKTTNQQTNNNVADVEIEF